MGKKESQTDSENRDHIILAVGLRIENLDVDLCGKYFFGLFKQQFSSFVLLDVRNHQENRAHAKQGQFHICKWNGVDRNEAEQHLKFEFSFLIASKNTRQLIRVDKSGNNS